MAKNVFYDKNGYILRLAKLFHFLIALSLAVLSWKCSASGKETLLSLHGDSVFTVFYAVIFYMLAKIYRIYALGYSRVVDLCYSHALAACLCDCIMYFGNCVISGRFINPLPFAGLFIVQCVLGLAWSYGANKLYYHMNPPKRTVIVYRNLNDLARLQEIRNFGYRFRAESYIENPGDDFSVLLKRLEGFEAVLVTGVHATLRNAIAKHCAEHDICGYFVPHIGDIIVTGGMQIHSYGIPVSEVRRAHPRIEYIAFKRIFDVLVSCIGIIVASPVMLVTALAVHACDGGEVFYRQRRLTKDGKEFTILKFRSMRCNAEKDGIARLAAENDDRITPVGRLIRACRIDELPQLFNILKGDMSLVGPRPERPEIAVEYEKQLPAFRLRLQVKAGLTGYAQVYGRYNTEPYDKLQMDLIYISRMSVVEDLRILFATVKVLFLKESTAGIAAGELTAIRREKESA